MRYLGGKKRQSGDIMRYLGEPPIHVYVEPFCGAMWSAKAAMECFPSAKFVFNDINPYLMNFWTEAHKGWNPPSEISEETYSWYRKNRPKNDPMTGYVGFAWSFGGKFFGGAARSGGVIKGSYKSTRAKIDLLRSRDVVLSCGSYLDLTYPKGCTVYMDPPYAGRTKQSAKNPDFDHFNYVHFCESLVRKGVRVVATEFTCQPGWEVVHDWGDTVVRHLNAKPKDGTRELLMEVRVDA